MIEQTIYEIGLNFKFNFNVIQLSINTIINYQFYPINMNLKNQMVLTAWV